MKTVKKIAIGIAVGLLAIVLVVAISFIAFVNLVKNGSMPGVNPISREGSQRVIVIEEELRNMGFLVTQEYLATIVNDEEDHNEIFGQSIVGTSRRVIFSYDVEVSAGINFEQITVTVDEDGKQILVMLPYAEIYGIPSIDTDSFEKYLDEAGIFTSGFDIEDHNDMIEDIQDQAVDRAIEVGIIDRANENARELVNNLVYGMLQGIEGYEDYSIVVTTVEPELSDVSNGK